MQYRAEIDGIRAVAVLIVVFFHLKVTSFSGGFIGVDIFYVISGYLVTAQILSRLKSGSFQIWSFYSARIRRLFPALFVTIALTFAASAWIMLPGDFENFGASALTALFSVSNLLFYSETGYWDSSGNLKPLLHTWSLGVEEQFYVFWPVLLMVFASLFKLARIIPFMIIVTVTGFLLSVFMTLRDESAAFYLFPFRIFQFSSGALAYLLIQRYGAVLINKVGRLVRSLMFLAGFLTIAACTLAYSGSTLFPGFWAVPPTLATVFLLCVTTMGVEQPFYGSRLLANPGMVWIGKLSYSLYLVHWPIIALYFYASGQAGKLNSSEQLTLFVFIFLAAAVLHYGVEARFYKRAGHSRGNFLAPEQVLKLIAGAGFVLAALAMHVWQFDGWQWRKPNLVFTAADIERGTQDRFKHLASSCSVVEYWDSEQCARDAEAQVLVYGNSLEIDAYNFLRAGYGGDSQINFIRFGSLRGCEGDLALEEGRWTTSKPHCQQQLDATFAPNMVSKLTHVVFASPFVYNQRSSAYLATITALKEKNPGIHVVVFGPYLVLRRDCSFFASIGKPKRCIEQKNVIPAARGNNKSTVLKASFVDIGATELSRFALLCGDEVPDSCAYSTPDGYPVYWDTRHFSYEFAQWSGRLFAERYPKYFGGLD